MRAIVVDDEPLARDELTFLLEQCEGVEVVGAASEATSALAELADKAVDVAFVDLRMPGPDGIALAESIKRRHPKTKVVVVSAHDDGAVRAFEAQVTDYLLKPVRLERLQQTLGRLADAISATSSEPGAQEARESARPGALPNGPLDRIAVRRRGSYVVIDVADILCFEVKDELVWATTADDRYALDLTLTAVEQQMPAGEFFRSHRSFLVRLSCIRAIEPEGGGIYTLRIDHPDNPPIPLARERARQLRGFIPFAG